MNNWIVYLKGGGLQPIADANRVVSLMKVQDDFESLFLYLFSMDRLVVMRAANAIEKNTLKMRECLRSHNVRDPLNLSNLADPRKTNF